MFIFLVEVCPVFARFFGKTEETEEYTAATCVRSEEACDISFAARIMLLADDI
jgi:hypothetical protein